VLVFMVLFHGANGVRIALFDLFPHWWKESRQKRSIYWVLGLAILMWLPAAYLMGRNLIEHTVLGG
jgi:succinate dehydrogenase/fumarate reductase cytochrome b subunit